MENLTYITGNYGKYLSVKEKFENENIMIDYYTCDLSEPEVNDISYISKVKAKEAYDILNKPVFVADSGFYINSYPNNPGYPGAFVKRSGVAKNTSKLLDDMKEVKDRSCYFLDCLTYFDGSEFYQFYGKSEGFLSYEEKGIDRINAKSNLWYVFIPKNHNKTLAEMTDDERDNRHDDNTSATDEFIKWYKENIKGVCKIKR